MTDYERDKKAKRKGYSPVCVLKDDPSFVMHYKPRGDLYSSNTEPPKCDTDEPTDNNNNSKHYKLKSGSM